MTSNQIQVLLFFDDLKSLLVLCNSFTDIYLFIDVLLVLKLEKNYISDEKLLSNCLQVACHLFQAGCNTVRLGVLRSGEEVQQMGELGTF